MKGHTVKVILAIATAGVLIAGVLVALGATADENGISGRDVSSIERTVGLYWKAKQHSWPEDERRSKRLSEPTRSEMRRERSEAAEAVTDGKLKEWEADFDPAGFLEELRASGTVVTETGYRVLGVTSVELVEEDVAQAVATVWSWSEQYEADDEGEPLDDPYKVDSTSRYRYTFTRNGSGRWRISEEDLLDEPFDEDSEDFGPQ